MNNVRCGERATFAGLLVLSAGALCVALTACSSGSEPGGGSLGSWGGTASSNGNGASGPTDPTGGNAGSGGGSGGGGVTEGSDASAPTADAGRPSGDGGSLEAAAVDTGPVEDAGSPANTFSLVNTNVNTIVYGETIYGYDPIPENSVVDLNKVGTALSARINPTPQIVGHIDFYLDGTYVHTEASAPYFLCGDNGNGTIGNCIQYFTNGAHMLRVDVYPVGSDAGPGPDGGGTPQSSSTLYFSVTDSEAGAPDAGGGG